MRSCRSKVPRTRTPAARWKTRNLAIVLPAAAELAHIGLSDALAILELMARDGDPRFEKAAARAGSAGYSPRHRP